MHVITPEAVELTEGLRRLRAAARNPTLDKIRHSVDGSPSAATLSRLFSGRTLPSERIVREVAQALLQMTSQPPAVKDRLLREVVDRYRRAKHAQRRARPGRPRVPKQAGQSKNEYVDPGPLQAALWSLIHGKGISLSQLADLIGVPKSTLHDRLRHPTRPPSRAMVESIARALRISPQPYLEALHDLENRQASYNASRAEIEIEKDRQERLDAALKAARRATEERYRASAARLADLAPAHAPAPSRATEHAPGPEQASLNASLTEVLVADAVTRPPAEIAALVAALHTAGHSAAAAQVVQEAVSTRSVDDVTALVLALLNNHREQTAASPPGSLRKEPFPPAAPEPAGLLIDVNIL
ncbi:helix-turn-helix transcriptional regulator [Streptomyces sp. NPDC091201]|uniref:helix-turn-helix domain-containing protein n=1 Tax=Streptomyces sp. NPDC091201 TaxID=3155190 RepID=UPI00343BA48E